MISRAAWTRSTGSWLRSMRVGPGSTMRPLACLTGRPWRRDSSSRSMLSSASSTEYVWRRLRKVAMSDWRVSRSTRRVPPGERSDRQTARLVARVVTPSPPLVEKTDVIRPARAGDWVPRRSRNSFSSAAPRSSRWTGRRRNSTAPARIAWMTKSAETLEPVAKTVASGNARARASTTFAGGPSGPFVSSPASSTMTRSGFRAGPSCTAWESPLNSPTTSAADMAASAPFRSEADSASPPTMMVRSVEVIRGRRSPGREVALAEGPGHDVTHARDAGDEREVLLLVVPEVHESPRVHPRARGVGLHELGGDQEQELGLVVLEARAAEEGAEDRNVAQDRDLGHRLSHLVVDEPGDGEGFTVLQIDRGGGLVLPDDRDAEPGRDQALAEVQAGNLRADPDVDVLPVLDHRQEDEPHPELLELDRDGVVVLGDREGELSAGEELGF